MFGAAARGAMLCVVLCLGSCTSLNVIHDPHPFVDRQQVPNLLKSMRCELITYIEANRQRRNLFYLLRNLDRTYAISTFPHYELSEKLFGLIVLDLKVQDTVGAGGTIDSLNAVDAATSRTWHFGPSIGNQNTYELNWSFLVPQDARLTPALNKIDPFQCYKSLPPVVQFPGRDDRIKKAGYVVRDFDGLARGSYPEQTNFVRVTVNGTLPLAAWLQDNSTETWANFAALDKTLEANEQFIPAQMIYTFAVQATVGLEVKFTLVSPVWSALAPNASGSTQQTSQIQIWLNGEPAKLASGAQSGIAEITSTPAEPRGAGPLPGAPTVQKKQGTITNQLPLLPVRPTIR
jgi:hypothetical protein